MNKSTLISKIRMAAERCLSRLVRLCVTVHRAWLRSRMRIEDVALREDLTEHAVLVKIDGQWVRGQEYRDGVQRATILIDHDILFARRYPLPNTSGQKTQPATPENK